MSTRRVGFGACPECGAVLEVDVEEGKGPVGVAHVIPMCAPFRRMEAGAFLLWVIDVREAARRQSGEA